MRSEGFYDNEKSIDTSWDRTSDLIKMKETMEIRMCNLNEAQKIFNVEAPWKMATGNIKKWMGSQYRTGVRQITLRHEEY